MKTHNHFIGTGIYTIPEAARLSVIASARVRRWVQGSAGEKGRPALWHPQLHDSSSRVVNIGFRDLMEIRFVNVFLKLGLSFHVIRIALDYAKNDLRVEYPFSTQKFQTDGKRIFTELANQTRDKVLLDLKSREYGSYEVLKQSLYDGLEFGEDSQIARWKPDPVRYPTIILDPQIAFGAPIIKGTGLRTSAMFESAKAEGSVKRTAEIYDVSAIAVQEAVDFEIARHAA